jgi:hypothetical protein
MPLVIRLRLLEYYRENNALFHRTIDKLTERSTGKGHAARMRAHCTACTSLQAFLSFASRKIGVCTALRPNIHADAGPYSVCVNQADLEDMSHAHALVTNNKGIHMAHTHAT